MGSAVKILPHYAYTDYCQWEGKWEIIAGIPYAMSPAHTPKHQYLVTNVGGEIWNQLKSAGFKEYITSHAIDYMIAKDTVVQPDVIVYRGKTTKPYLDFTPKLVAEILSPATSMKDRHTKFNLYEQAGVAFYLLVNPETEVVQVFALESEVYVLKAEGHGFNYAFELETDCRIEVDFEEIW